MKLIELNPRWFGTGTILNGVTFDCPHCRVQRLGVTFANPIDPEEWLAKGVTRLRAEHEWKREGTTFETLSLTPSVDSSPIEFGGHWHGVVRNGEVT